MKLGILAGLISAACGSASDSQAPRSDSGNGATNAAGDAATTAGSGGSGTGVGGNNGSGAVPGIAGKGNTPCVEPATVQIPAWGITNSGVYVKSGATVKVNATGTWSVQGEETGPDGRNDQCDRGLGMRVAKFFDRQCAGSSLEFTAKRDGYLWFFQDTNSDNINDVAGSLSVTISGGDSCSGMRPEGMLSVLEDPAFDQQRLTEFEKVCGSVPTLFDTDSPSDPAVQAYVKDFMGGDPEGFLRKAVIVACAVNYATTELAAHHGQGSMRLVHYIGAQKWEDLGRPKYKNAEGKEYWDFALSFKVEELSGTGMGHYGRWGTVGKTTLHETGHVFSPVGRRDGDEKMPRWLNETYADLLSDKMGAFGPHDNPENWVLWSRTTPYCSGYGTGSLFLDAMDRRFPGFIHKLSEYIVNFPKGVWPGSEAAFQAASGQSLEKSYAEYLTEYELTLKKSVAECDFPNDQP